MNKKSILDDFRYNDLGSSALQCILGDKYAIIPYEEENIVRQAVYLTIESFRELENSSTTIQNGKASQSAVALWFLAIESFFARIVKTATICNNLEFKKIQSNNICSKIESICELLEIGKIDFRKTKVRKMLLEFNEFRNCFFHAGSFQSRLDIKHTVFSSIPTYLNQADVIQSADIALSIMCMFRHIFSGLDIIPTYFVKHVPKNCFKYIGLDVFYDKVILSYFYSILNKHSLISRFVPLEKSVHPKSYMINAKIIPMIKLEQDTKFEFCGCNDESDIYSILYVNFVNKECLNQESNSLWVYNAVSS